MTTLSEKQADRRRATEKQGSAAGRLGRKIGLGLLAVFGALVAVLAMVPVLLLPVATAVPVVVFILLLAVDGALLVALFAWAKTVVTKAAAVGGIIAVGALAVLLSQWYATTPAIVGADGEPLPNSIAVMEPVELGGRTQWITIRGEDQDNPVLLFFAGGPGGSQLAATRKHLGALEKDFVVVNWDQPGVGKSYHALDFETATPEQYVRDAHELTLYLQERFGKEKIYLLGESWGNILGVWLVQRYPEDYHALVGAAQMVAFLETDTYNYELAMEIARERGDTAKVEALERQGPPPYHGEGTSWKVAEYVMYLSSYMAQNPEMAGPGYDTIGDIAAVEYGLYDKVNYVRGLLDTMDHTYPQLWGVDFREQATELDVPVYFIEGRLDVNAPPHLVEEYMQVLDAPHKEIIWFEHSGHSPWIDESGKLYDVMVNKVLPETS